MTKKKIKIDKFKLFDNVFFIVASLLCIVPFLLLISISFSLENDVKNHGFSLLPEHFTTEAYKYVLSDVSTLINAYGVTIIYAIIGTILSVAVMAGIGYSLSRDTFIFKKPVTIYLLITMLFGGGLVPSYIINTQLFHLDNTIFIYLLSGTVSAYTVFVFRTFFKQLPKELVESANLDGASEMQILTQIIVPLSKPVLATFGFMGVISRWNSFDVSLYYITNTKLYTLQYLLQNILNEAKFMQDMAKTMSISTGATIPTETMKFAMCILAAGPMILLFPFFQKYFTKGMVVGAVKG